MTQEMSAARLVRQRRKEANQLVINYEYLRKAVGWIGTLLPLGAALSE